MKTSQLVVCALGVILSLAALVCSKAAAPSQGRSVYNDLSAQKVMDPKVRCHILCSSGEFCPFWCPEHALMSGGIGAPFKRAPFRDNEGLGSLSFDDYLFLKMMGRTRR